MSGLVNGGFKPEAGIAETFEQGSSTGSETKAHDLQEGYVVDSSAEAGLGGRHPKLVHDGHTVLIPLPSDDPEDPLNWSKFRKHVFLYIIAASAFPPDYGSAVGDVTLLPQAAFVAFNLLH